VRRYSSSRNQGFFSSDIFSLLSVRLFQAAICRILEKFLLRCGVGDVQKLAEIGGPDLEPHIEGHLEGLQLLTSIVPLQKVVSVCGLY
jgi:hypothetical protein